MGLNIASTAKGASYYLFCISMSAIIFFSYTSPSALHTYTTCLSYAYDMRVRDARLGHQCLSQNHHILHTLQTPSRSNIATTHSLKGVGPTQIGPNAFAYELDPFYKTSKADRARTTSVTPAHIPDQLHSLLLPPRDIVSHAIRARQGWRLGRTKKNKMKNYTSNSNVALAAPYLQPRLAKEHPQ